MPARSVKQRNSRKSRARSFATPTGAIMLSPLAPGQFTVEKASERKIIKGAKLTIVANPVMLLIQDRGEGRPG
ncbi:hypothetical protein EYF80_007008 [Liparis tanakae]|uniref:Uncharacterized protein n=1 Tax=Liparis tanakae TaxID=230148 RepID=A0A4Z2IYC1_9TELE|nr:hypothetical protein EYF80_007008 [Liparis tanakae]